MRSVIWMLFTLAVLGGVASAQNTFTITGTEIPAQLLQQNYGKVPKGITGYDLSICNISKEKQSVVSSEIYQALAKSTAGLQPIGRQIMLASILRNQNRSKSTVVTAALSSVSGVLSILSSSKYSAPTGLLTAVGLGTMSAQQILTNFKPVMVNDQLEKFENEVLEPALVLDSGSCVEKTMFATILTPAAKANTLSFHVR